MKKMTNAASADEFETVKNLCERLGQAAKALGPNDMGMACIEAQHFLSGYVMKHLFREFPEKENDA
jgi:hypothetical protein